MSLLTDAVSEYTIAFALVTTLGLAVTGYYVGRAWLGRLK